ncbi:hypothetical protein IV38_GL000751 [Lactobacillus selangorensis]|uniref:Phage protein n=2 Tax=Lactobacillaceae TaxID=33958 RepID=A0A0R2FRH8_9LACO|nr:hypothetical protein IV38_GL000751 [Lactobacillus selangorensis]
MKRWRTLSFQKVMVNMTRYRKIATNEAERFDGSDEQLKKYKIMRSSKPHKRLENGDCYSTEEYSFPNGHGMQNVAVGDWIITEPNGDNTVLFNTDFRKTYEKVD